MVIFGSLDGGVVLEEAMSLSAYREVVKALGSVFGTAAGEGCLEVEALPTFWCGAEEVWVLFACSLVFCSFEAGVSHLEEMRVLGLSSADGLIDVELLLTAAGSGPPETKSAAGPATD